MTLSDIKQKYIGLIFQMTENGGEVTDDLFDDLQKTEGTLAEKFESYSFVLERMAMEEENLKEKAKAFEAAAKVLSNSQKRIKEKLLFEIESMGKTEIKGITTRFKIVEIAPKLEVLDESKIDKSYFITEVFVKLNKDAVVSAINNGAEIEGVQLKPNRYIRQYVNAPEKSEPIKRVSKSINDIQKRKMD